MLICRLLLDHLVEINIKYNLQNHHFTVASSLIKSITLTDIFSVGA